MGFDGQSKTDKFGICSHVLKIFFKISEKFSTWMFLFQYKVFNNIFKNFWQYIFNDAVRDILTAKISFFLKILMLNHSGFKT